ncbi:MAG: mechanosensitive ion channel [Bacteroidales bacterium]|nr:mechanosensitive ion channel [Bacteroidales bacterium]
MDLNGISDSVLDAILTYGPKLLLAIITLLVGLWLIRFFSKGLRKTFEKREIEASLSKFLVSLINVTLKILLIISVVGMVGVQMTSFIALLGAAGLAFGMALSGTLQNFAGGVVIILIKPFKVGEFIEAQGHMGTVEEIQIFNTILKTPANQVIFIPNGGLSSSSVVNYSREDTRRMDLTFGISYSDDIDLARKILDDIIKDDDRILDKPAEPMIAVKELNDSSVDMMVRLWLKNDDYWDFYWGIREKVKKAFDEKGISIPFPQTDVHLFEEKNKV